MSFILDALKKSERRHRRGTVPDVMTVHSPALQKPKKHLLWIYLFLAAMLINAGILTAFLRPWESKNQDSAAQPAAEQRRESKPPPPVNERDVIKKPPPVPDTPAAKHTLSSANTDKPGGERPADVKTGEQKTAPVKQSPEDNTAGTAASLDLNPSARELKILREKINEERSPADNLPLREFQPVGDIEDGQEKRVTDLGQLPSAIRKELPDISIKGHIYSDNPSSRIVNINGVIMHEGDTFTAGLKVEKITVSGVIFDYRGLRFRIRVF